MKQVLNGPSDGCSPVLHKVITWINADLFAIGLSINNSRVIEIQQPRSQTCLYEWRLQNVSTLCWLHVSNKPGIPSFDNHLGYLFSDARCIPWRTLPRSNNPQVNLKEQVTTSERNVVYEGFLWTWYLVAIGDSGSVAFRNENIPHIIILHRENIAWFI